ncbi:MAG TPA: hypothetical protein VLG74_01365, partial [Blastocatellia bacterium]|nr:hypothetical protein [Blastocatellia bacterium]
GRPSPRRAIVGARGGGHGGPPVQVTSEVLLQVTNRDGRADSAVLFATLTTPGSEGTGIYFPCIQHSFRDLNQS